VGGMADRYDRRVGSNVLKIMIIVLAAVTALLILLLILSPLLVQGS
jgi:hypothetical protein